MAQHSTLPRGIRNNNPLNIRHSDNKWLGRALEQTDKSFVQFKSVRWGLRAAIVIMRTYINKYHCDSPARIIARWAPACENNVDAYVCNVAKHYGWPVRERIKFTEKNKICTLVQAMAIVENGGNFLDFSTIETAYGLAVAKNPY